MGIFPWKRAGKVGINSLFPWFRSSGPNPALQIHSTTPSLWKNKLWDASRCSAPAGMHPWIRLLRQELLSLHSLIHPRSEAAPHSCQKQPRHGIEEELQHFQVFGLLVEKGKEGTAQIIPCKIHPRQKHRDLHQGRSL